MDIVPLSAPAPGQTVTVGGPELAWYCLQALLLLTAIRREPDGLVAILERVRANPQVEVQVVDHPRRLRDRELGQLSTAEWCLPDTAVLVNIPALEGLRSYALVAGLSTRAAVGIPRSAMRFEIF